MATTTPCPTRNPDKPYPCCYCQYNAANKKYLKYHQKRKHPDQPEDSATLSSRRFPCTQCAHSSGAETDLQKHIKLAHLCDEAALATLAKCGYCEYHCTLAAVTKHENVFHAEEPRVVARNISKSTNRVSIDTTSKPLPNPVDTKEKESSREKSAESQTQQVQAPEEPYYENECECCGSVFASRLEILMHMRTIHMINVSDEDIAVAKLEFKDFSLALQNEERQESIVSSALASSTSLSSTLRVNKNGNTLPPWMVNTAAEDTELSVTDKRRNELLEKEVVIRKCQLELMENREVLRDFAALASAQNDNMEDQVFLLSDIKDEILDTVHDAAKRIMDENADRIEEAMAQSRAQFAKSLDFMIQKY
eukprot:CFRG4441T1